MRVFGSRRLLQIPKDLEWEVKRYDDHTLHLVNTDIDDLLDVDDARIAAENAEKKAREEEEAAAAAATATTETTDNTADSTQAPPPAEPLAPKEASPVTSGTTEGKTDPPDGMDVEGASGENGDGPKLAGPPKGRYYALCLHFTLPAAAYATMCLREITQQDTSTSFHTSLNALAPGQHPGSEGPAAAASEDATAAADVGKGGAVEDTPGAKILPPKGAVIKIGSSLRK